MNRTIRGLLQNKIILFFLKCVLYAIPIIFALCCLKGSDIIIVVMVLYFICRIINRISEQDKKGEKNKFWTVKAYCYILVGIVTIVPEAKAPTIATTMLAVIAFIEAFDLLFENWLNTEEFYGYDLNDLRNTVEKQFK